MAAIGTLLGAIVGTVSRYRKLSAIACVGVLTAAMVLFSGVVLPKLAYVQIVPSAASASGLLEGLVNGWVNIINTLPPIGGDDTTIVIPFFCAVLGSFISVHLALRTSTASK